MAGLLRKRRSEAWVTCRDRTSSDANLLAGQRGPDSLVDAGLGDDSAYLGSGLDVVTMGDGDDFVSLNVDPDQDEVDCGAGEDEVQLYGGDASYDVFVGCETVTVHR